MKIDVSIQIPGVHENSSFGYGTNGKISRSTFWGNTQFLLKDAETDAQYCITHGDKFYTFTIDEHSK